MPTVIKDVEPPKKLFNKSLLQSFFKPLSKEDTLVHWQDKWTSDLIARDTLLESMRVKGVFPTNWTSERESTAGLYPNISDPDFAARIARKTEFAELRSETVPEDICQGKEGFDTTPVQRLVARFLHPKTPYRGVLLDHGVGVGKTCSAITVAETFLEVMPENTVYILCPQAIASGFRRTIFDAERLIPIPPREAQLRGEVWESYQCTGMTYPRLTGMENETNRRDVENMAEYAISRRYKIMGYLAFANWVLKKIEERIPKTIQGAARDEAINTLLHSMFSDHLIIIDEAHNLRDAEADYTEVVDLLNPVDEPMKAESPTQDAAAEAAEGKKLTPILRRILKVTEGLRLMLMSATPMYNTAPEILFLLNLLLLNDTKEEGSMLKSKDFFTGDGSLLAKSAPKLASVCGKYISYMRGENPASFPLRITPAISNISELFLEYPSKSISKREGSVKFQPLVKRIMGELPLVVHKPDIKKTPIGRVLYKLLGTSRGELGENEDEGSEVSDFILNQAMQIANITYPSGSYGSRGWDEYWAAASPRQKQYVWRNVYLDEDDWTPTIDEVFGPESLGKHAPKIQSIAESLTNAKGMCFAFSRFVKAGALPLAIALERRGWTRVLADGSVYPVIKPGAAPPVPRQCAFCVKKEGERHEGHSFAPANFVLLTGDETITPDFRGTLRYANTLVTDFDRAGGKVKAILGSQVASEGLDLKCIRENHLLDGWYHLNRIEQIEGRAVRYCSHAMLPKEHQNCLIYLHVVSIPEYETADLYAYRLACKKAIPIGQVQRIIKINAWDCSMNRKAVLLGRLPSRRVVDAQGRILNEYDPSDKAYTSICDFQERCEFVCASREMPEDKSTYDAMDARRRFKEKEAILRRIYKDEIAYPLSFLEETVYGDMPWEIGSIGLRNLLNNPHFVLQRGDGIRGQLTLQNGYVVFQPLGVTQTDIPLTLRYGRAYGRLPRFMELPRDRLLEIAKEVKVTKKEIPKEKVEEVPEKKQHKVGEFVEEGLKSLREWNTILPKLFASQSFKKPESLSAAFFEGWRWVFHHYGSLPEVERIAQRWWMDTIWTHAMRSDVLAHWISHGMNEEEKRLAGLFHTSELYKGDVSGYATVELETGEVVFHCFLEGDDAPQRCTGQLKDQIQRLIGYPVDRMSDTDAIFGFMIPDKKTGSLVFKSVKKPDPSEKATAAARAMEGAQCANNSKLENHLSRTKLIQERIRHLDPTHPMVALFLDEKDETIPTAEEKLRRKERKEVLHIHDLTQKQLCPYMELLLRMADRYRIGKKRWFLSHIEAIMAGYKLL